MTFNVGHVEGGTGAGRKRPLRDKPKAWVHDCDPGAPHDGTRPVPLSNVRVVAAHFARCPVCKQERP